MGQSAPLLTFAPELLGCFLGAESLLNQPGEAMALVEFLVTDTTTGSCAVLTAPRLGTWGDEGQQCRCLLSVPSTSPGSHLWPHPQYLKGASIQTAHLTLQTKWADRPNLLSSLDSSLGSPGRPAACESHGTRWSAVPQGLPAAF